MAATSLRFKDRFDGSFILSWKARATLLMKEKDLWEICNQEITPPTDPQQRATHEKEIKVQRVILDVVYDLIPHLSKK
jgi:hypothetical protein